MPRIGADFSALLNLASALNPKRGPTLAEAIQTREEACKACDVAEAAVEAATAALDAACAVRRRAAVRLSDAQLAEERARQAVGQ